MLISAQTTRTAIEEFSDFLTSSPLLEDLANLELSEELEARISHLLHVNSEGQISREEMNELNEYAILENLMGLVKIKAQVKLAQKPQ